MKAASIATASLALALVAVQTLSSFSSPESRDEGAEASAPAGEPQRPPSPSSALMLTVQLDHRGVRVLQALRKPGLEVRLPRDWESFAFRWRLLDADENALAEGGFDPGPVCLDPAFAGRPRSFGDTVLPALVHTNLKVPDWGGVAASIEFLHVEGEKLVPFGECDLAELRIR